MPAQKSVFHCDNNAHNKDKGCSTTLYIPREQAQWRRKTNNLAKSQTYLLDFLPVFGSAFCGHDGGFLVFARRVNCYCIRLYSKKQQSIGSAMADG